MSQQNVTNGPTTDGNSVKIDDGIIQAPPPKPPTDIPPAPSYPPAGPFLARPPLLRTDSRQNFNYRPPFPNVVPSSGPQSLGTVPPHQYNQGYSVNSGPQSIGPGVLPPRPPQQQVVRQPVQQPQFVQRGPPLGPGGTPPPRGGPVPGGQFPPGQQQSRPPIFRPQTPYPRPPLLAQRPQIFQQSSVPSFNRPRPSLEDSFYRSQTLDTAEIEGQRYADGGRSPLADQRPPSVASLGRSMSSSSQGPFFDQKRHSGSQESINISRQGSMENVTMQRRYEDQPPSRPDSRPPSRMDKIDESKTPGDAANKSHSQGIEMSNGVPHQSPSKEASKQVSQVKAQASDHRQEALDRDQEKKNDLDLKLSRNKGDNDSGVDESTQGNDQSCNGDSRSPRKSTKSRTSSTTPTKGRSLSRGSKTPSSLQSPDSAATTPGSAEKKKVPMNKIQVGAAPSPNLKVVKSKIGSLENYHYKPGGGKVKIENKKLEFKNAAPRIEAKNERYLPKKGEKKIITQKLEWNAKSKIGSLENATYKPKGGDKKIESVKLDFKDKAKSKIGSKDNIKHQPGGGDVKIENKKIELHANSKVGSLDNVKHKPAGGDKKIFDDKEYLKQQKSGKSSMDHSLSGSQHSIQSQETKAPVADENLNQHH
ncbi:microtubule-associated protein tau [Sitophilus oryzae]|uniref:Microtubule-associated protein n=1 Tax=Sitophilus oryzae TaxID=7048 RepID=A0A6J2XXK1_SITOR|nr:microtubule-associated protein tau [Sitophilus oryzae]